MAQIYILYIDDSLIRTYEKCDTSVHVMVEELWN